MENIKKELPPNWDEVLKFFPVVEKARDSDGNLRVVFTYAPYIYVPGGQEIPADLYVHESIHIKQQGEDPAGWWRRYFDDSDFRLEQELEAYGAQLAMFNEAPNRVFQLVKDRLATDLASEFYGRIISYGEAAAKIRSIARSLKIE